jgi:hypothetical protein
VRRQGVGRSGGRRKREKAAALISAGHSTRLGSGHACKNAAGVGECEEQPPYLYGTFSGFGGTSAINDKLPTAFSALAAVARFPLSMKTDVRECVSA